MWCPIFWQTTLHFKKCPPFSYDCSFYKCWPIFYNIWYTVYRVNVQHNCYLFTHLTYILLLRYLGKHWMRVETSHRAKLHMDAQKLMPYLCQDAQASFSSILTLRLMAVIITTLYWRSRRCHPFVPLLVMLMDSRMTVHQCTVRIRWSSSFSLKLWNSLLQTYGLQIVLILTL